MCQFLACLLAAALLALNALVQACEENAPCDKCAKESELSWNPDNRLVSRRLNRFYSLDDQIKAAYASNDFAAATKLANEYLDLARTYRCNWNYGNAIHDANRFLGLVALKNRNLDAAATYLLKAGRSTGSPQLNSFGPELDLANALLQEGQVEPVKSYLRDIKRFWEMDNGQVSVWLTSIEKGEKPELNRFSKQPSAGQMLLFWFAIAWPVLVVTSFLYFLRRQIARKWLFGIAGLLSGYVAMMVTGWTTGYLMPRIISSLDSTNASLVMGLLYMTMAATFLLSLLAIFGVSRFFVVKGSKPTTQ
jgi:hypothetical protein